MADQKIIEYIKTSLSQGKTQEDLYKELMAQGLTVDAIQENFYFLKEEHDKEGQSKKTIRIILVIGAILIGAGIFSFLAANWRGMSNTLKLIIIITLMLVAYAAGWQVKEKYKLVKTGQALIFLGAIIYGAGIFLVAQMFNIRANWPDGFILWMLGALAMAFVSESYSLFYLALLAGVVAIIGHPVLIFNSFRMNSFFLTSSILLIIATIITFVTGLMIRKKIKPGLKEFY